MLSLSTYQLNAITKATMGKTCLELINEYVILEAKRWHYWQQATRSTK